MNKESSKSNSEFTAFYLISACCSQIKAHVIDRMITDATYSVEQSKQCAGSQTTAWHPHVSQFYPHIPPWIVGLHGCQRMLPVSEQTKESSDWLVTKMNVQSK